MHRGYPAPGPWFSGGGGGSGFPPVLHQFVSLLLFVRSGAVVIPTSPSGPLGVGVRSGSRKRNAATASSLVKRLQEWNRVTQRLGHGYASRRRVCSHYKLLHAIYGEDGRELRSERYQTIGELQSPGEGILKYAIRRIPPCCR